MWARKRIDIRLRDMAAGMWFCALPKTRTKARGIVAQSFRPKNSHHQTDSICLEPCSKSQFNVASHDTPLCLLSVRSGLDLLLQTQIQSRIELENDNDALGERDFRPPEIIFSGLTIPDMPRIAESHGLRIVPVDIDAATLSPSAEEIEAQITPQTYAIVVAHLMGGLVDIEPIARVAKKYGVLLIEDCAQAYIGNHFTGSDQADVSMFSFGSIKTNTALGGAVFFVRDQNLKQKMLQNHVQWATQSNLAFAKRILKFAFVKTLSTWPIAASIRVGFRLFGTNHDATAASLAKGFAGSGFFDNIRHQPSSALLSLMAKRISEFDTSVIESRRQRGELLQQFMLKSNDDLMPLGCLAISPTHWVFAVLVENPNQLASKLWNNGFDATPHSSLRPVWHSHPPKRSKHIHANCETGFNASNSGLSWQTSNVESLCQHLVFLPIDSPISRPELIRMAKIVAQLGIPPKPSLKSNSTNDSLVNTAVPTR